MPNAVMAQASSVGMQSSLAGLALYRPMLGMQVGKWSGEETALPPVVCEAFVFFSDQGSLGMGCEPWCVERRGKKSECAATT